MFGSPAAARNVGSQSLWATISLICVPGLMTPGQRSRSGTRCPPSQVVPFSPWNGVQPPSGQEPTSAPLSVLYMTIVLSAIPRSSNLSSNSPNLHSNDAITVAKQEIEYSFVLQCPRIVDTVSEKNLC